MGRTGTHTPLADGPGCCHLNGRAETVAAVQVFGTGFALKQKAVLGDGSGREEMN